MILIDVNVLVYAHREDAPDHARYAAWLEETINSEAPYGVSNLILSGFLRVVTHPRIFASPTPLNVALAFASAFRDAPKAVSISPGPRHWNIFVGVSQLTNARGNRIPDAYHAALAIESGSEWITTDRGFARFPGLRWAHPLDSR